MVTHFDSVLPKSQAEVSVVKQRLIRAGYRKESTVKVFYGSKFWFRSPSVHPGPGHAAWAP